MADSPVLPQGTKPLAPPARHRSIREWSRENRVDFSTTAHRGQEGVYILDKIDDIIQQLDDSPSVYREAVERAGHGLHHFGVAWTDHDAALAHYRSLGFTLAYSAEVANGARVASSASASGRAVEAPTQCGPSQTSTHKARGQST